MRGDLLKLPGVIIFVIATAPKAKEAISKVGFKTPQQLLRKTHPTRL